MRGRGPAARRERPHRRRAAEQRDELAPSHLMLQRTLPDDEFGLMPW
jgi:hypothetical protein